MDTDISVLFALKFIAIESHYPVGIWAPGIRSVTGRLWSDERPSLVQNPRGRDLVAVVFMLVGGQVCGLGFYLRNFKGQENAPPQVHGRGLPTFREMRIKFCRVQVNEYRGLIVELYRE